MNKRETFNDFNQQFIMVLTKFIVDTTPSQSLAIEYYIVAHIPSIGMFFNQASRDNLSLNFDEAKTIERELSSYNHHFHYEEIKLAGKKPLLITKSSEKKPKDIDSVVMLVKKLLNEVVDIKKNVSEGYLRPRNFHPLFKRNEPT
jgi:hypothetical protein